MEIFQRQKTKFLRATFIHRLYKVSLFSGASWSVWCLFPPVGERPWTLPLASILEAEWLTVPLMSCRGSQVRRNQDGRWREARWQGLRQEEHRGCRWERRPLNPAGNASSLFESLTNRRSSENCGDDSREPWLGKIAGYVKVCFCFSAFSLDPHCSISTPQTSN